MEYERRWFWPLRAMSDRIAEFIFDDAETARVEASLETLDVFLRGLAQAHQLRFLPHASKGWPGRTLYRRKWLKTYSLRVSLDPAFQDLESPLRWEIHDVWMYDVGEFGRKTILFRSLAKDIDSNHLDNQQLRDIIRRAVEENTAS